MNQLIQSIEGGLSDIVYEQYWRFLDSSIKPLHQRGFLTNKNLQARKQLWTIGPRNNTAFLRANHCNILG